MKIAQVAPLYESVPPKLYGGTERVVSYLTEELVRRGHEVTLFASGDSTTKAKLEAGCHFALRLDKKCVDQMAPHVLMLEHVFQRAGEFDLIHCHLDYLVYPKARLCKTPVLTTLHGRLDIPELAPLYREFSEIPVISISDSQREPLPYANWVRTIYHGLPQDLYTFQPNPGKYLAFLGRICPEKRVDAAIRIAIATGLELKIAAKVDKVDREYFEAVIRPLLMNPLIDYIGEIGEGEKSAFLGNAAALIFPIDWPEPFGLVMIEALACGTPVIARHRGSVPEVLQEGVTGFICQDEAEAIRDLGDIGKLNRKRCREVFEERFSVSAMGDAYIELYEKAIKGRENIVMKPGGLRPA